MPNLPENKTYDPSKQKGNLSSAISKISQALKGRKEQPMTQLPPAPQTPPANNLNALGNVTTPYGGQTRTEPVHEAVDVANKVGTPIPMYAGGTVTDIETGKKQGDEFGGNYIVVTDTDGNKWRYSHLSQAFVRLGDKVEKGQVGGLMGNSGNSYSPSGGDGSHLELKVRDMYNNTVDPNSLIK